MGKNSELLAVKITPKLYLQIRKAAEASRRTISDFVRISLEDIVANGKSK